MQTSYLLAAPYIGRRQLDWLDTGNAPAVVSAMLSRLLPPQPKLVPLRANIAQRLRQTATKAWLRSADLAEVCIVLDGMHAYDPHLVRGSDTAILVQRLLATELAVGGPYAKSGRQADIFTNACIAQCMSWLASPLPNVLQYLLGAMPDLVDVELPDWPLAAAIHMLLEGNDTGQVQELLGSYDELLVGLALAITGSLALHLDIVTATSGPDQSASSIYNRCRRTLRQLPQPLQTKTRAMLDQVIRNDADHEISQLARYYGSGLVQPPRPLDEKLYLQLGLANLYAWAAYSIYDDFLDNEGRPDMLGTANYSFRNMLGMYNQILPELPEFQAFVDNSLTTVDQANALEVAEFRFASNGRVLHIGTLPDFTSCDMLADRALFHILGPMAVLAGSGIAVGSSQWVSTLDGFRHYLIARQLNDDIHDWQEDLAAGQSTFVVVSLLRHMNIQPGVYVTDRLTPHARQLFWQSVLPVVCDTAMEHLAAARHGLRHGLALAPDSYIPQLLDTIQASMQAAKTQRADARVLLSTFRS